MIDRTRLGSHVTLGSGDTVPCNGWLITIGRRSFIITTYKRPTVGPASRRTP